MYVGKYLYKTYLNHKNRKNNWISYISAIGGKCEQMNYENSSPFNGIKINNRHNEI